MRRPGWDPEREIRDEIDHYLDERTRELEARGLSPGEARRRALEAFGDRSRIERQTLREDRRARPGGGPFGALRQDVRFAVRALRRRPAFASAVLVTIALGIGANTAVYSAAEAVFLQAPPVDDPGSVVAVYTTCRDGHPRCSSSYPDYVDLRDGSRLLEDLAARSSISYAVSDEGMPAGLLTTWLVTGNYFPLLGVQPAVGRLLNPGDHDPAAPVPVAVLAFDTWRDRYGADPSVVGRTIRVNGVPVEVVGVAPRGFRGIDLTGDPQLFIPMATGALMGAHAVAEPGVFESRGFRWIGVLVGRLRAGATTSALREEMTALGAALNAAWPDERGPRSATVDPAGHYLLPQYEREALTRLMSILGGVVVLTLGLACANVANLLLARATARRREMAVRVALGASRWRILRQGLTEGLVLALAGAGLGLGFAWLLLEVLARFPLPGDVSLDALGARLDGSVLLFSTGLAVLTGLVFGLVPALRSWRRGLPDGSGGGLRGEVAHGRRDQGARRGLVAVQVALCLVLMLGSGLFLRSLTRGLGTDLGFRPPGVALARFDLSSLEYGEEDALAFLEGAMRRIEGLPRVIAVGWGTRVPFQVGGVTATFAQEVGGYQPAPDEELRVEYAFGRGALLEALGVELLAGRDELTAPGDAPALLVDAVMAERYWGSPVEALGGRVRFGEDWYRIAGVTRAVRWHGVDEEPRNYVLLPAGAGEGGRPDLPVTFAVRTGGDASALLPILRRELQAMEPDLTFYALGTAQDLVDRALAPQRMGSLLFTAFALLAVVLAALGIGSIVAYAVARGRREIAVRIALGATRQRVVGAAVLDMATPFAGGLLAGTGVALLVGGALEAFLVGTGARDPAVYAAAIAVLAAAAALAALVPARAAARVDPVTALRET